MKNTYSKHVKLSQWEEKPYQMEGSDCYFLIQTHLK